MTTCGEMVAHPRYPNGLRVLKPTVVASAARLRAFSVTADSIVATVMLTPAPENAGAQVHWGDDQSDFVDFRRLPTHTDSEVPAGSFKLQHVYQPSVPDGLYPSRRIVIIAVQSVDGDRSFETVSLDLRPRYRCRLDPTLVKATHHDSAVDERSEFTIKMNISGPEGTLIDRDWPWKPQTLKVGFPGNTLLVAEFLLEDSATVSEVTLGEDAVQIVATYIDDDGWWGSFKSLFSQIPPYEFDGSNLVGFFVDPKNIQGPFALVQKHTSDSAQFEFHFSGSMDLIIPLDRGPLAVL